MIRMIEHKFSEMAQMLCVYPFNFGSHYRPTFLPFFSIFLSIFLCFPADWFKAGKGPDPAVASLDRDMDAYFQGKAAVVNVSTLSEATSVPAESVPMTV